MAPMAAAVAAAAGAPPLPEPSASGSSGLRGGGGDSTSPSVSRPGARPVSTTTGEADSGTAAPLSPSSTERYGVLGGSKQGGAAVVLQALTATSLQPSLTRLSMQPSRQPVSCRKTRKGGLVPLVQELSDSICTQHSHRKRHVQCGTAAGS